MSDAAPPPEEAGSEGWLQERLDRIERLVEPGMRLTEKAEELLAPAWQRVTQGEPRWQVSLAVLGAIVLQLTLPYRLSVHPRYVLPAVEVLLLVIGLVQATETEDATKLLLYGGAIWLTNVLVFALWYWELDRGGPVTRMLGARKHPDFLFAQMASPEVAPEDWEPMFLDYFYLSFTNATAFSPTDTLPLTRWAKMLMLLQSAVSLATVALVIARAVNILK